MIKLIAVLFLSLLSVMSFAEVQVQLEPSQITLGDTFQLTLTQDRSQNAGAPDLTALQKNFAILGTERSINYSVINGQTQSINQWVILLKALKPGIFTIPAIKLGSDQSAPITINVSAGSKVQDLPDNPMQQQDIVLLTEVHQKQPFVNQQVVYKVKIYVNTDKQVLDASYQGPQVDNALLMSLGEAKRYRSIQNNTNYIIEEQQYVLFPQKSGTLKITSPILRAMVFDFDSQRIQAQDKSINLTVAPIPKQYTAKTWLPAKKIALSEQYENTSQSFSQGSTLVRTITLEGVGVPTELLPNLSFDESDVYNVYPEKGTDQNQAVQGDIVGSKHMKITYLFNKSGKVTIPELRVPWFNTETKKNEVAVLAPRSLDISPSGSTKKVLSEPVVQNHSTNQLIPAVSGKQSGFNWGWIAALFLAIAWVVTLFLWRGQKKPKHTAKKPYKKALDELNKACAECNPQKARDALLQWGALHWPDAPLLNLTDLAKLVRDVQLKKQINLLSQVLYKTEEKALWRGDELVRAVNAIKQNRVDKSSKANVLPPINPF